MANAFRITVTPFRLRRLWWTLHTSWGCREGVNHTECRHHRFGPVVLHVYKVRTGR